MQARLFFYYDVIIGQLFISLINNEWIDFMFVAVIKLNLNLNMYNTNNYYTTIMIII